MVQSQRLVIISRQDCPATLNLISEKNTLVAGTTRVFAFENERVCC